MEKIVKANEDLFQKLYFTFLEIGKHDVKNEKNANAFN